jgi:hypothetical protein
VDLIFQQIGKLSVILNLVREVNLAIEIKSEWQGSTEASFIADVIVLF